VGILPFWFLHRGSHKRNPCPLQASGRQAQDQKALQGAEEEEAAAEEDSVCHMLQDV